MREKIEYKGFTIEIEKESKNGYNYYVFIGTRQIAMEGVFNHKDHAVNCAKKEIDRTLEDHSPNKYTPTNRPPYPWISVEDELPIYDAANPVLGIIVSRYDFTSIKKVYYFDGEWYLDSNDKTIKDFECRITHWQYLPALPE